METSGFVIPKEELDALYSGDHTLNTGLVMDEMEGAWVAWETDIDAIAKSLPPFLKPVAPFVMAYIINAKVSFTAPYEEAAIMFMVEHDGQPGAYLQSMLLSGEGGAMASYFGREMAGMPKKVCEGITIDRQGDDVAISIVKSGVKLFDCTMKLGEYNTSAGNEIFGANDPANVSHAATYLTKLGLEQAEDGHMYFDNGRLLLTENDTKYEYWTPATAEVTLTPCLDANWASVPVKQVLAGGFGKYRMYNFTTKEICPFDASETAPYLVRQRYDDGLFV